MPNSANPKKEYTWAFCISYFRGFRGKCFAHNNEKNNLGKFGARSDEGIFVDYSSYNKAYRIRNKQAQVIKESIHIVFDKFNDGNISTSS